jgi:hypothetical protein
VFPWQRLEREAEEKRLAEERRKAEEAEKKRLEEERIAKEKVRYRAQIRFVRCRLARVMGAVCACWRVALMHRLWQSRHCRSGAQTHSCTVVA